MHLFQINILTFIYLFIVLLCSNTLFYLQDCLYWCMYNTLNHTYIHNRLPEDEPSGSKHVEDTTKIEIKILIYEMCILLVYIV